MQILLAVADVKIKNLMERNRDEIRSNLAGRGLADQGFAAAWRPIKQHATSYFLSIGPKQVPVLERINDLHPDLLLNLFHAAYICERGSRPAHFVGESLR